MGGFPSALGGSGWKERSDWKDYELDVRLKSHTRHPVTRAHSEKNLSNRHNNRLSVDGHDTYHRQHLTSAAATPKNSPKNAKMIRPGQWSTANPLERRYYDERADKPDRSRSLEAIGPRMAHHQSSRLQQNVTHQRNQHKVSKENPIAGEDSAAIDPEKQSASSKDKKTSPIRQETYRTRNEILKSLRRETAESIRKMSPGYKEELSKELEKSESVKSIGTLEMHEKRVLLEPPRSNKSLAVGGTTEKETGHDDDDGKPAEQEGVHDEVVPFVEDEPEMLLEELEELPEGKIRQIGSIVRWQRGNLIGFGSFGRVYLGMNLDSGELFVVKQVVFVSKERSEEVVQLEREIALLATLDHVNIVKYLGTERNSVNNELSIFLEHMPGGSVADLVSRFGPLVDTVVRKYTREVLAGLQYLHSRGIIHRDIKGQNILVDNRGVCKLADFGSSRYLNSVNAGDNNAASLSLRGTPVFMPPEVIKEQRYSKKSDVWSIGCTVLQMASGKPPYNELDNHYAVLIRITSTDEHPPFDEKALSEEAKEFLLLCCRRNPADRPDVEALLKHKFMKVVQHKYEGVEELDLTDIDGEELKVAQSSSLAPSKESSIKLIQATSAKTDQHDLAQVEASMENQETKSEQETVQWQIMDEKQFNEMARRLKIKARVLKNKGRRHSQPTLSLNVEQQKNLQGRLPKPHRKQRRDSLSSDDASIPIGGYPAPGTGGGPLQAIAAAMYGSGNSTEYFGRSRSSES